MANLFSSKMFFRNSDVRMPVNEWRFKKPKSRFTAFDTQRLATSLSHLKEVRLLFPEGLKRCFEGLFHPEIASESNFDLESHLLLNSQQFTWRTVDDFSGSGELNLF